MQIIDILIGISPIIVIFVLLAVFKRPADVAGVAGWVLTLLVVILYFGTSLEVALKASLSGVVGSLPITLMVVASIFQVTYMMETGAVRRIVTAVKTIARDDKVVQILVINVGFGTLLAALGATPVSILPPIMLALGYSSFVAIALPSIGYDALCTYALLGIPVVVFSAFTGLTPDQAGFYFARFMPVVSTLIAFGMLYLVGGFKLMLRGSIPTIIAGITMGFTAILMNYLGMTLITGVFAGIFVVAIMLLYMVIRGKKMFDRSALDDEDRAWEKKMGLLTALSPWLILVVFAVITNLKLLPFYDLFFNQWNMPLEIIPGKPEKLRILWQAYFWVTVSTFLAMPFLRPAGTQLKDSVVKWLRRSWRPALSAAVFFAIAYAINHSGKVVVGGEWVLPNPDNNIIYIIANSSANTFGNFYGLVAPFLGLLGGFVSGSETSSIAMLTKLHLDTAAAAEKIEFVGLLIAAASGIGGGLASVISPAKLQNAAAIIDAIGEEGNVLRKTFVISLLITLVVGVMVLLWTW